LLLLSWFSPASSLLSHLFLFLGRTSTSRYLPEAPSYQRYVVALGRWILPCTDVIAKTCRVIVMCTGPRWFIVPYYAVKNFRKPGFWDLLNLVSNVLLSCRVNRISQAFKGSYEAGKLSKKITWDDEFVGEVDRTVSACAVFFFFLIFWLCR
jgi:hypothetical protein